CEYHSGRLPLYHFDVYRVVDPEVLFEIGAEEYFYAGGVSIVEWADMVAEILPEETICIFIEYGEKEGERIYQCTF
ncbi:MAG: tRNA (adenosine(37)-N6)-threonylcarbamoyltransferase complex ATPase subunit type 1 TsaE, partial [Firmicutes bacterium]|nr:tRNA (adenosine(37)-N6)-threonylcarbamoyltransferase complex ATPase subunit type 1 TsaE [Bacillota bacterium]